MGKRMCTTCGTERAVLKRPKTHEQLCRDCFYLALETEVHLTILQHQLFKRGERVAIAASGGKDSTVLAHMMTLLNARHNYGLDLFLLSIDEGISGYRDDSLETVKRNEVQYQIPLAIVSYKQLYGWTMDEIVAQIGTRSNCTFCGVFRRQALDRGAVLMSAGKIATGHNADDVAETVLLNILRGDVPRLGRCTSIITGEDSALPRVKPFKYTYEKEIVMYAYFKKLDYFSTECIYAPFAARGFARDYVKDLEAARPSAILDLIHSAEDFRFNSTAREGGPPPLTPRSCERCGYICSQPVCKACVLLEGLNKGIPRLGVMRTKRRADGTHGLTNGAVAEAAAAAGARAPVVDGGAAVKAGGLKKGCSALQGGGASAASATGGGGATVVGPQECCGGGCTTGQPATFMSAAHGSSAGQFAATDSRVEQKEAESCCGSSSRCGSHQQGQQPRMAVAAYGSVYIRPDAAGDGGTGDVDMARLSDEGRTSASGMRRRSDEASISSMETHAVSAGAGSVASETGAVSSSGLIPAPCVVQTMAASTGGEVGAAAARSGRCDASTAVVVDSSALTTSISQLTVQARPALVVAGARLPVQIAYDES